MYGKGTWRLGIGRLTQGLRQLGNRLWRCGLNLYMLVLRGDIYRYGLEAQKLFNESSRTLWGSNIVLLFASCTWILLVQISEACSGESRLRRFTIGSISRIS